MLPYKTELYKAFRAPAKKMKEELEIAAKNRFDGVEITGAQKLSLTEAREFRHIAEANGIRIHSLSFGWTNLNNPQRADEDIKNIRQGLRIARACGADAILLVPCQISEKGVLPASDFKMEFDPLTCNVTRITDGDNTPYREYIRQQNQATECCFRLLEELLPTAAYEGIVIGIENVWSNLWVTPELMAAFLRHFDSRWVKAYFDMGNHLKYAPTERWLKVFKKELLIKLHIKDFVIDKTLPAGGKFVPLGTGDIDWLSVRKVLEEVGYNGWVTLEDVPNHYTPAEHSRLLDEFFAGVSMTTKKG